MGDLYHFVILLEGPIDDQQLDLLYEGGFDDGLIGYASYNGGWFIDLDRESTSLSDAVSDALSSLERLGISVRGFHEQA